MSRQLISISVFLSLILIGFVLSSAAAFSIEEGSTPEAVVLETAVLFQESPPEQEETSSNFGLLDGLGVIFAVISVYIVTMFTMAIGTEILVDIIKGILGKPLGLKSRPNAREKLEAYQTFLPGALSDLGVSAEARLKLERQIDDLQEILEPAFTVEVAAYHLKHEEIAAAFDALDIDIGTSDAIEKIKGTAHTQIDRVIKNIDVTSTLGQAVQRSLETAGIHEKINKAIDRTARRLDNQINPDSIYNAVCFTVSGEIADGVTKWATAYLNTMQTKSVEAAESLYQNQLLPQILNFGLGNRLETKIQAQFETFLDNLRIYRSTDIYLESVNGFLAEVEKQRNIVRSSAGKLRERVIDFFKTILRHIPFIQHPQLAPDKYNPLINDSSTAAAKLLDLEEFDKEQNKKRIRRIRLVSFILGTLLAYLMQIDSADLLSDLFPADSAFLYLTLIPKDSFVLNWIPRIMRIDIFDVTAGVLLTGLAASAGSTFWHDQLKRLQTAKEGAEKVQTILQPIVMPGPSIETVEK